MRKNAKRNTKLAHSGSHPLDQSGILNPPIYRASTVDYGTVAKMHALRRNPNDNFVYGRLGTPTSAAFEEAVAALEGAERTIAVGSGLAAISAAMLAFLGSGDHVLVCDSAYSPTRNLCEKLLKRFGVTTTYYDPLIGSAISDLFQTNTKVIYTESPGSHTFEVQDIPAITHAAHKANIKVVMDNTWGAGFFFKPFEHGVDICVQAATKYLVGHSDAMVGTISMSGENIEPVINSVRILGYNISPDDAFMALRGMRTLNVRLKRHETNGLKVAQWLSKRKEIDQILHPALSSCPGHDIWKRDFTGSNGLFGVVFKPLSEHSLHAFIDELKLFRLGGSWGGYESLVLPTEVTRTATKWEHVNRSIRFHIGLEDPDDLISDIEQSLESMEKLIH